MAPVRKAATPADNGAQQKLAAAAVSGGGIATQGLIAGLIGYVVVALFFALSGVMGGRSPFAIAALLGATVFGGAADNADIVVEPGVVFAYNGLHLAVFLAAGLLMAWLAALSERAPQAWYPIAVILIFGGVHVFALPIWFDDRVRAVLPLWQVVAATMLAGLLMGAYLWRARPDIRRAAHEPDEA